MAGCKSYRKHLSAYLDGAMPPKKQAALADHLKSCDACRKELSALEGLGPFLERLEIAPPPADMAFRIMAAARRRQAARAFRRPVLNRPAAVPAWLWGLKAVSAAVMLILMLYLGQLTNVRGWLVGSEGRRPAVSMTASSGTEGLEWFAPGPPGSILSGYLAMAGQTGQTDGMHR